MRPLHKQASELRLLGMSEVAEKLRVSRQRVHQLASSEDFPLPVARLKAGAVWLGNEIESWQYKVRKTSDGAQGSQVPPRDPERPQDDPWDADAVRYLMRVAGGNQWSRSALMECLREQPGRLKRQPELVDQAIAHAAKHGVERRPDAGGTTIHFFRTDADAPRYYPRSAADRRGLLSG